MAALKSCRDVYVDTYRKLKTLLFLCVCVCVFMGDPRRDDEDGT